MRKFTKLFLLCAVFTLLIFLPAACKGNNNQSSNESNVNNGTDTLDNDSTQGSNNKRTEEKDAMLTNYDYSLSINGKETVEISDMLFGLFFEDINFAIDGGLYAEMIKNRSFEFGSMATGREKHGWITLGDINFEVIDGSADGSWLNENNPKYARLTNTSGGLAGIGNTGFLDGISVVENAKYDFSTYLRSKNYKGNVVVRIQNLKGDILGEAVISGITNEWRKYEVELTSSATASEGIRVCVLIENGTVDIDMVSLFPRDTYKGRKNGLRKDIAEKLEALNPKFLRFPGGCVIEGKTLESAYNWKDSIGNGLAFTINGEVTYGDVATRPLGINLWGDLNNASANPYYMTYGMGFYEYFLLCEDLGAEPLPVLNCGTSCQIQGAKTVGTPADILPIGSEEFNRYVQDALDLVEFCRGGADTKWGAIRIAMGHEEPFKLTYIGIGNEQWGDVYFSRYEAFKEAFEKAAAENPEMYGGIKLVVANGPVASDRYAWDKIKVKGSDYAGLVDEHYYMTPGWFLQNTHRYDSYDRNSTPVFLGEYAAKSNNAEAALAEAAYMTGLERNGDIVRLASYAPLFGNSTQVQWSPDLIWFNNHSVWGSVNYYVQKIFANNKSDRVLSTTLDGTHKSSLTQITGKVGLGTWMTSATFDNIKVVDNATGDVLFSEDFSDPALTKYIRIAGSWSVENGQIKQSHTGNPSNSITGDIVLMGDSNWSNYTLTLTATKLSGSEGFLIPFAVKNQNNYYHWNIGGWGNTVSCLEQISAGSKSGQIAETVKNFSVVNGKAYNLKIVVTDENVKCYLDDQLMIDYDIPQIESIYQVTGVDENDLIIKIVNVSNSGKKVKIQANDIEIQEGNAKLYLLAANSLSDMNSENEPEKVTIQESTIAASRDFIYEAPKYSVSVIRIPLKK